MMSNSRRNRFFMVVVEPQWNSKTATCHIICHGTCWFPHKSGQGGGTVPKFQKSSASLFWSMEAMKIDRRNLGQK
jgi:hypothetical protein